MAKPVHVTEQSFDQEVVKAETPVLVDFWAEWCGPCRLIAPIVEDFAREYEGKVKVAKVDVDDNQNLAMKFSIMSIPTLGVFKGGQLVERIVGYMPKVELKGRVDAAPRAPGREPRGLPLQPALRLHRGHAAEGRRGNRLAVGVVVHVAGDEDALHAGHHPVRGEQVALGVRLQLALEDLGVGLVADGDEDAVGAPLGALPGAPVAKGG